MALSVEATIAIVALFVATPAAILALSRSARRCKCLRNRQSTSDQSHRLPDLLRQWTVRRQASYIDLSIEDEVRYRETTWGPTRISDEVDLHSNV
ncbi:hypothetical protein F5B20DRAFT_547086 [Whalleya microplaca]|nr:hypothetical protein F5B20DRAFT_547086 [Whalleya microplaca]